MHNDPDRVVLDQLVITFTIPKSLPDPDAEAARRMLESNPFLSAVSAAIERLLSDSPTLSAVAVELSSCPRR